MGPTSPSIYLSILIYSSRIYIDKGSDRYYILQGYNKIIKERKNEYRFFFHNGKKANYLLSYEFWALT